MKVNKILVGFDGSPSSYKAIEAAFDLAAPLHASVHTLTVIHLPDFSPLMDELDESIEEAQKRLAPQFQKVEQMAREHGLEVNTVMLIGHPAETLIRYAAERQFDLLIIGTRGLGGFKKMLIGSVALKVVTYSTVPVLVIRE